MRFGDVVRARRADMSLRAAAHEVGIDHSALHRCETGEHIPCLRHFVVLVKWIGMPMEDAVKMILVDSE